LADCCWALFFVFNWLKWVCLFVSVLCDTHTLSPLSPNNDLVQKLKPALEKYGAALYLSGHDHDLQVKYFCCVAVVVFVVELASTAFGREWRELRRVGRWTPAHAQAHQSGTAGRREILLPQTRHR
jgi:hypothetical protein